MEPFLAALEASEIAGDLRTARWGYAAVSGAHVLGLALLIGAVVPLDLRLLGFWPRVEQAALARVLVPVAAAGLGLAIAAGVLLFAVRAGQYAALGVVQLKLALVALGTVSAAVAHLGGGWWLERLGDRRRIGHAALSLACWLGALACGRAIAFAGD